MLSSNTSITQQKLETSLIEQFLYPKLGPGQMWEEVARIVVEKGGEIHMDTKAVSIKCNGETVTAVEAINQVTGEKQLFEADYLFSSMPVQDLIAAINDPEVPLEAQKVAQGLQYRDFITVGLLLRNLKISNTTSQKTINNLIPDNWIYIQDRDVKLGRLQIFNNWSPYMVKDPDTVWIGLEYFCTEGDELWNKPDSDFVRFAIEELVKINIIDNESVMDSCVLRVPKAYPAYFGSYDKFNVIRKYTDNIANMFLIGRNGMHRYNNADHSMLTAMVAIENIINNSADKANIWEVNAEDDYHEAK
jgi:protoporphyrinogen oxidase